MQRGKPFILASVIFLFVCSLGSIYAQTKGASEEQNTYFLGESKMTSPTGQPYGTTLSLIKRTVKPEENKIIEQVISINQREAAKEFIAIFDVRGSKFTMAEQGGGFTGEGELIGKAWEWTAWKSTSNLAGGKGKLISEDTLTKDGVLAKKSFYSPDGQLRAIFSEDLKQISKEMYDILRSKVLPR